MTIANNFILNFLENSPNKTAGEIWNKIKDIKHEKPSLYKLLKALLPEEDQSIRKILTDFEYRGIVKHQIRYKSILKEWSLAE